MIYFNKSANCFKLEISTSAVACIRAHRPGCNLRRQHLRLQLDVNFFSSRLHAKLIHYLLMNYVSEDFSSFVDANKFVDVDEGKLCAKYLYSVVQNIVIQYRKNTVRAY